VTDGAGRLVFLSEEGIGVMGGILGGGGWPQNWGCQQR
jgi:hypothetical protein